MDHGVAHEVPLLIIQLSIILLAANVSGEITERFFKAPGVLGELVAGIIIGPYALGGVDLPFFGALFPLAPSAAGVSVSVPMELYFLAQIAAIILLFLAGLETDLKQFLKYTYPSLLIGLGGVVLPFCLGVWATVFFGYGESFLEPAPLFMGAIMTATSVGITARVLNKVGKTNSPEGVTILASAVLDDILGVMILGAVVTISTMGNLSVPSLLWVGGKSLLFLALLVFVGFFLERYMDFFLNKFQTAGSGLVIPLGICFIAAATAELFGLAMIIGAYIIGLAFSASRISTSLEEQLSPVYHVFVPIFFVVMGMLVDLRALEGILLFGTVITVLAILGKVLGSGLPSLLVGFNARGGMRIGLGMLPRGEVALIIAGVGVSAGIIKQDVYSVSVMMTLITTLIAPVFFLNAIQTGGTGLRKREMEEDVFPDVSALEDSGKFPYQLQKRWEAGVGEEWRNHLIKVLSGNSLKRIRSIHGRECHLFTFQSEKGEQISIYETLDPETSQIETRLYANMDAVNGFIREADRLFNKRRSVSFVEGQ